MAYFKLNLKWLFCFFCGFALVLLARYAELEKVITPLLQWIDSLGTLGAIAFVAIYIVATSICIPGSMMALAGGALFGKLIGSFLVYISGLLGAYTAFWLGRSLLRDWIQNRLQKNIYLKAVNKIVADEGWKIACLLHLSPIIPFNMLNYALGTSRISQKNFVFATAIGILPGVILYTFLGSTISDLTMVITGMSDGADKQLQWIVSAIGIVATLGLTVYLARIAQRKIEKSQP